MRKFLVLVLVELAIVFATVFFSSLIPVTPEWFWPAAGLVCFAVAAILYRHELMGVSSAGSQAQPEPVPSPPAPVTAPPSSPGNNRAFTNRTVAELLALGEGLTSANAARRYEPHMGKWLRVQQRVCDVSEFDDKFVVSLGGEGLQVESIWLKFDKASSESAIETLDIGDRIAAVGRIEELRRYMLELVDCELVPVEGKDDVIKVETED